MEIQVNLLGPRSRLSLDVQCPTDGVSAASLLSDIDRAVSAAVGGGGGGIAGVPGPVHLNFMFRENLAPVAGAIRCVCVCVLCLCLVLTLNIVRIPAQRPHFFAQQQHYGIY